MKKPILYFYNKECMPDALLYGTSSFDIAVPFGSVCDFNHIMIPKDIIEKVGEIQGRIKYIHDNYKDTGVILIDQTTSEDDIQAIHFNMQQSGESVISLSECSAYGKTKMQTLGHSILKSLFSISRGYSISDIYPKAIGLPCGHLDKLCKIEGSGIRYIFNLLLSLQRLDIKLVECAANSPGKDTGVSISFRDFIREFFKIGFSFILYISSSLISSAIDLGVYTIMLSYVTESTLLSLLAARLCSSPANYMLNQRYVFFNTKGKWKALVKYYMLVAFIFVFNYFILDGLIRLFGWNPVIAQIIASTLLFIISYCFQRFAVFRAEKGKVR